MTAVELIGVLFGLGLVWFLWSEESRALAVGASAFLTLAVFVSVTNGP